jgi:hypothetical protein
MKKSIVAVVLLASALATFLAAASADARVFKGGSNEKAAGTVVNTHGGGGRGK